MSKIFFKEVDNVEELAKHIGCNVTVLRNELIKYNNYVNKDEFGKTVFPIKFALDETFYVAIITPAIHYTMGGLKIDKEVFFFLI